MGCWRKATLLRIGKNMTLLSLGRVCILTSSRSSPRCLLQESWNMSTQTVTETPSSIALIAKQKRPSVSISWVDKQNVVSCIYTVRYFSAIRSELHPCRQNSGCSVVVVLMEGAWAGSGSFRRYPAQPPNLFHTKPVENCTVFIQYFQLSLSVNELLVE